MLGAPRTIYTGPPGGKIMKLSSPSYSLWNEHIEVAFIAEL